MYQDIILRHRGVNTGGLLGLLTPPRILGVISPPPLEKKVDFKIEYLLNLHKDNLNVQILQIFQI